MERRNLMDQEKKKHLTNITLRLINHVRLPWHDFEDDCILRMSKLELINKKKKNLWHHSYCFISKTVIKCFSKVGSTGEQRSGYFDACT